MTIREAAISLTEIPLETPFVTALRRVETVQAVRFTLTTQEGLRGIGEAPPTEAITGESLQSIDTALQEIIAPLLEDSNFETIEQALAVLHGSCDGNCSAKAAAEMALYDLYAQAAGLPLYCYLGGSLEVLHSYVTISLNHPKTMADEARKASRRGLQQLKVKLGGKDALDMKRLAAVRRSVPDATILVDPNQAWTLDEALSYLPELRSAGVEILEQPLAAKNFEGLRLLTAQRQLTIMADEAVFTLDDAKKVIKSGAADMVNIKLMKCGGISKAVEIIGCCETAGVKCMMGSMLESPVSIAAAAHLAMAYPQTVVCCDLDSPLLYRVIAQDSPVTFEGDRLILRNPCGI